MFCYLGSNKISTDKTVDVKADLHVCCIKRFSHDVLFMVLNQKKVQLWLNG